MGKVEKIIFNASNKAQEALNQVAMNTAQINNLSSKTVVTLNHQFADATVRDAYFTANPTELVANLFIKIGTVYQQYLNSAWTNVSAVVIEQLVANQQLILDAGNHYTSNNVEGALQEVGSSLDTLTTEQLNANHTIRILPNGVKNEIINAESKLIKRISDWYNLKASNIKALGKGTNVDWAAILRTELPDVAAWNVIAEGKVFVQGFNTEVSGSAIDNVSNVGKFATDTAYLYLIFAKGTYADLATVQTALTGTKMLYQLATPVDVPLPNPMSPNTVELTRISELVNKKADIAQEAWITPTLTNGWVEFDVANTPKFRKDQFGNVQCKGLIKGGVAGSIAFTFPTGYKPTQIYRTFGVTTASPGQLSVTTSGSCTISSFTTYISLDNIMLPTI